MSFSEVAGSLYTDCLRSEICGHHHVCSILVVDGLSLQTFTDLSSHEYQLSKNVATFRRMII